MQIFKHRYETSKLFSLEFVNIFIVIAKRGDAVLLEMFANPVTNQQIVAFSYMKYFNCKRALLNHSSSYISTARQSIYGAIAYSTIEKR